jgi:hypothetical protein
MFLFSLSLSLSLPNTQNHSNECNGKETPPYPRSGDITRGGVLCENMKKANCGESKAL